MNNECVEERLRERTRRWQRLALATSSEPFTEEASDEWKWMSREYAEHKLRLPRQGESRDPRQRRRG